MTDGRAEIDALIAAEKTIVGVAKWKPNRESTVRLKATLAVNGAVRPGLILDANANTHTFDQHGAICLIYQEIVIERLNFHPHDPHTNRLGTGRLSGLVLPMGKHRYYPWSENQFLGWPRDTKVNLAMAESIALELPTYAEALAYFLDRTNIKGDLIPPPYDPLLL